MKNILKTLLIALLISSPISTYAQFFGDGNIGTLDQWTSVSNQITQRTSGKAIKITGLTAGLNLCLDVNNVMTTNGCTGGGGGSGGGTWATTTSTVSGQLINYPNNTTDIPCIGGTATSTCKFYFDPNLGLGFMNAKLLVGSGANTTDFAGAQSIFSQSDTGVTTSQKVGVLGEAVASVTSGRGVYGIGKASGTLQGFGVYGLGTTTASTDTATIYGVNGQALATHAGISVGVSGSASAGNDNRAFDGVGTANGTSIGYGIVSTGKVSASADTATAYGGYFQSIDTHAGGSNIAVLGSATGGATNYSFYGNNGTLFNSGNVGIATTTPGTALGVVGDAVISGHLTAQDYTSTSTRANIFPYASTTALTVGSNSGLSIGSLSGILKATSGAVSTATNGTDYSLISALSCSAGQHLATVAANGSFTCTADSGGGGSGGGSWATTTSTVSGQLVNYSLNNTDIVSVGGTSTSTSQFYLNPNGVEAQPGVGKVPIFQGKNGSINLGTAVPLQANGFGTGYTRIQTSTSSNDIEQWAMENTSAGTSASTCFFFGNDITVYNSIGAASANYGGICQAGSNYNLPGFNGIKPAGMAVFSTNYPLTIGSGGTGLNASVYIQAGSGLDASYDAIFQGGTGNLGVGTSSPYERLSINGNGVVARNMLASNFTATSSVASIFPYASTTAVSVSGLTSGNCVQAGTGGLLTTIGSACGSGGSVTGTTGQVAYLSGTNTAVGTSSLFISAGQLIGIGTTSPWGMLSIHHPATGLNIPLLAIASSTQTGTTTLLVLDNAGNFTVGSTTATTTNTGGFVVGQGAINSIGSSAITAVSSLQTGNQTFDTNAGIVQALDLPIDSSATVGTVESYSFNNMGSTTLTLYGLADGSGFAKRGTLGVAIGTSTPFSKLTVWGEGTTNATRAFAVVNNASTTNFQVLDNGVTGVGTTSPFATFAVNPTAGNASNQFVVGSSTATNLLVDNSGHIFTQNLTTSTAGNAVCILTTGELVGAGGTTCPTSSIKTKHDVSTLSSDDSEILRLNPVKFTYNERGDTRYGLIAEEVAKIDPILIETATKDLKLFDGQVIKKGEPLTVNYSSSVLTKLIKFSQDMWYRLSGAEKKIKDLENKVSSLQSQIDAINKKLK